MSKYLTLFFILCSWSIASSQYSNIDDYQYDFFAGVEISAIAERYPGLRISAGQRVTKNGFIRATYKRMIEEVPEVGGNEIYIGYMQMIKDNPLFFSGGVLYHKSTLTEDVIFSRLGTSFFEEIDIPQNRTYREVNLGLGVAIITSTRIKILLEVTGGYGEEVIEQKKMVAPVSEMVENQRINDRFIYNTDTEIINNGLVANGNISIVYTLGW